MSKYGSGILMLTIHFKKNEVLAGGNLINLFFPIADRYTKYIPREGNFVEDSRNAS